ncbi:MAG: ATP-binding protein [Caulobacteraceae bacterium]
MKLSLRSRLSLSYITIAMVCVLLISVIANLFLESYFREYVIKNQEKRNDEIASLIKQQYQPGVGWNKEVIQNIGINALENGMIVSVKDTKNNIIWDAAQYNNGMCERMLLHMSSNMSSRYPNWKGKYEESEYPISVGLLKVGTVKIGYYGPFYFTDRDLAFINSLNRVFTLVGLLSLLLSLVLGYITARRISTPISRVINTAEMISKGFYDDRCNEISNITEIGQLTVSINDLAESLEKQEKLRKRLTADVAHELRTPIATLQSHIEAIIDGIWEPDVKRLNSIHEEIMRIGRMVGDLEKLAKYESETLSLNKTEFDLSELISNILLNFEKEYTAKGINVSFEGGSLRIYADKDKISQLIINLICNAIKFTPQNGQIHVEIEDKDNAIMLSVSDTGIGISEDDLPHIFERFYRADTSRSRQTGGSGIGLTIVKAIVEAHKGTIRAESKLQEGTKFIITLPKK